MYDNSLKYKNFVNFEKSFVKVLDIKIFNDKIWKLCKYGRKVLFKKEEVGFVFCIF